MKQLKVVAACGLFCMLSGGAIAADKPLKTVPVGEDSKEALSTDTRFAYTYAQLNYTHTDYSDADIGEDGFGVSGSFLVIPNVFVVGGFGQAETDEVAGITLESTGFNLGAGYRYGLTPALDLVGTVSAVQMEVEALGETDDDTGFLVTAGARYLPLDMVEVAGTLAYQDIFEDGDFTVNLSGLYHIIPLVSAGVNLTTGDKFGEGIFAYGATVRFNF